MIKNDKQREVTMGWIKQFRSALEQMDAVKPWDIGVNVLLWNAQRDGIASKLSDLENEVLDYDLGLPETKTADHS